MIPGIPEQVTPYRESQFDGCTYSPGLDQDRLTSQMERVRDLMADGLWRSLTEIRSVTGGSEAGVSARLRDLRKGHWGHWRVERRRRGHAPQGLWEYRCLPLRMESNGQVLLWQ